MSGALRSVAAGMLYALAAGSAWGQTAVPGDNRPVEVLPDVQIIATPVAGAGIDRDKVPGTVQTLSADDFSRNASPALTDTLAQRIPGVSLSDPSGNGAAQELDYRGFAASPLPGSGQGLAVYLNGIRLNEAFGDTVNWDLIPTNAIERGDVWTNNPVFGLNALGGAVNLQMKSGFTFAGSRGEAQGGSFGRVGGAAEYGARQGEQAAYLAAQALHDDGWRFRSPTDLGRGYVDLGRRGERGELHLIGAAAWSSFGAAAATPLDLLARDNRAVFTTPQTTQNSMGLLGLNGKYAVADTLSLQGNLYVRGFRQRHVDGNPADTERCSNSGSPQFQNRLCLEDDGFPRPSPVTAAFRDQFAILDQNGNPIPCPSGTGNTCNATPYGTIDRTATKATTLGGSLQATGTGRLLDHANHLVLGAGIDRGSVNFAASSALGFINPDLTVRFNPAIPGVGATIHTMGGFGIGPVNVDTDNTYYGIFLIDTLDLTERLSATAGARLNIADITIRDRLGANPELNGNHSYTRLNPVAGLTYKLAAETSVYAGYSEANRAPTPVELSCADRAKPCLLENSLVADPPLRQVVARTYEAGLRDRRPLGPGRIEVQAGLFRIDTADDIVNLASVVSGRGFFQNVPGARRQGLEASLRYRGGRWTVYAGYNFLDATYRFTGDLPAPNNPMADPDGNVHVTPGKRIPGNPRHQGKLGFDFMPTTKWQLGADLQFVGARYFIGDDANQNPRLSGYWLANLHASYQLTEAVQLFGLLNNAFDKRYALFGTYFAPASVAKAGLPLTLTDRRTEVLGPPLSVYGGVRVIF
jgi:iron complex outermembrane receptor protein